MNRETADLHYRMTAARVREIQAAAARALELAGELDGILEDLRKGWTGEASEAYRENGRELQERIRRHARQLRRSASGLAESAVQLYQAEIRMAEQEADAQRRGTG